MWEERTPEILAIVSHEYQEAKESGRKGSVHEYHLVQD
jgi:hypothetical protein